MKDEDRYEENLSQLAGLLAAQGQGVQSLTQVLLDAINIVRQHSEQYATFGKGFKSLEAALKTDATAMERVEVVVTELKNQGLIEKTRQDKIKESKKAYDELKPMIDHLAKVGTIFDSGINKLINESGASSEVKNLLRGEVSQRRYDAKKEQDIEDRKISPAGRVLENVELRNKIQAEAGRIAKEFGPLSKELDIYVNGLYSILEKAIAQEEVLKIRQKADEDAVEAFKKGIKDADKQAQNTRNKSDLNLATDAEKQIISTVRETITHYHNMGRSVQDTDKALADYRSQLIRQQDIATFDAVVTQEKANFAQKLYEEWKREADKRTSQSAQQSQDSRINSPVIESLHKQYEVVRGYEDIIKSSKALGLTLDETEAKLLQHYAGLSSTDQAIFRDIDKDKDLEPKKTASEDYENSIAFAKEVTKAVSELKSLIKLNGMGVLSSPAVVEQATLNPAYGAAIGRIQEEQISDEKKANDPVAKALADVNAKKELRSKLKTITDEHGLNSTVATDFAKNLPGGEEELLRQRAAAQAAATGPISVMLGKNSQLSTFYGIKSSIGHKADTYEQISKHGFTEEGGIGSGARSKAGSIIAKVGGVIGNEKLENKGEEMASTSKGLSRAGLAGLVIMLKEGVQGGLKVVGDALSAPFKVFEGMKSLRGLENIDELMKDVMKVITSTIGAITGVISGMMDGISKGISSGIEGMANILTAILNVITTVMNLIIDSSPLLQGMLKLFMKMVNLILMPIGNIIAMLILPVLRRNLPKIVELTQKGAKIMQEVMNGDSSSLKSFLSEIGKTLGVFIGEIVATLSPAISTVFTEVFPSLVSAITTPVDVQRQKTSGESLLYKNRDGETIGINQKTLSALSTELKASWLEGLTPIMETISKSPFDYMVDAIVTAVTDERVKAAFAQIFKSALGGAQGVVDEVKDSMTFGKDINTAIGYGMDLAMMAGPLALVGIYDLGKKLHLWADGGVATKATPGIFGEAGPEAIIPLSELPSMVSQINERGDGAMVRNGGITFIFNGDIYGMEDFEAKVRGVATAMNSEYRFR